MFIGSNHTILLLKWMILQSFPIPSYKNLQDPSGTPPWFNRPQGTRRFFGSPPPGPTRSYWFEPCRDTQGLQGFSVKARCAKSRVWMARKCRRNLRLLFLKLPRKAFRKNCLPNKMFPPKTKRCFQNKVIIFLWCVSFMIVRFHMISLQWLSTK